MDQVLVRHVSWVRVHGTIPETMGLAIAMLSIQTQSD